MKKLHDLLNKIETKYLIIIVLIAAVMAFAFPAVFLHETNLDNYTMKVYAKHTEYTGEEITPKIKLSKGIISLKEDRDYIVHYKDNIEVGTATASIEGTGRFFGERSCEFKITKAEQTIEGKRKFKKNIADEFNLNQDGETALTFKSSNPDIATVDKNGEVHC